MGFKGDVQDPYAYVIKAANQSGLTIIAIDPPSGLNGETGIASSSTINATETAYLLPPKSRFFLKMMGGTAWAIYAMSILAFHRNMWRNWKPIFFFKLPRYDRAPYAERSVRAINMTLARPMVLPARLLYAGSGSAIIACLS